MRFCFLCPSVALGGKNTPRCYMKITMLVFLPRDARAERGDATVSRLSVCLSVWLKASALADTQHRRSGATGTPPKLGLNRGK